MTASRRPHEEALVGGRERRGIVIVDYDPAWPARFARVRTEVAAALGAAARRIEHVGSTAVPGLGAKPIVDVLVVVAALGEETVQVAAMAAAGYELRVREPAHRMFRTPARDVHVHVWGEGDPEIARMLWFRDRLRADAADRAAYAALKRELARRDWEDMNDYADAKGELIEQIIARAHTAEA